jgi:serine/threonine-protein kinase
LGLLAILALAGRQGFPRERIESYLWPESSSPLARHSLDQTVYAIRHALGSDFIISTGRELRLNPDLVQVDLWNFEEAIRARQWAAAADRYKGTLLDGFHFSDSRELESLIDSERARLRGAYQKAVEFLANAAAEAGDHSQSVTWWRRLANSDPLSAAATKKLMIALAAAGDRAGAVKQARFYQELVRQQLEIEPDSEIESLAASFSRPALLETAVSPEHKKTSHDRPGSAEHSPELSPSVPSAQSGTAGTLEGKKTRPRDKMVLYALIPIAILTTAAAIWGWMRPAPSEPVVRYTLVIDSTESLAGGQAQSGRVALSPDGSRLAYVSGSKWQLLIRPRNQLHAIAVRGTEGVTTPFFSSDGSKVGFLAFRKIWMVPVDGGSPITVTDTPTGLSGASWGSDDFIYVDGSGPSSLLRIEAKRGAKPEQFTELDTASREVDHTWPDVLPNGKGVLFTVTFNGRNVEERGISHAIAVADIPSGKHRVIVDDAMYPRYASSGHLLYVTKSRTLMAVPFDQNSMTVTGKPIVLTEGMRLGLLGSADLAVSANGTLVYATGAGEGKWEIVWVTRNGKAHPVDPDWTGASLGFPALSPDGKWVAVARSVTTDPVNIWIKQLDRGASIKLTLDGSRNVDPEWTPDGRSLTFSSDRAEGAFHFWTKRVDGSAQAMVRIREKRSMYEPRWSPDGKWLVFQTDATESGAGDILGIRPGLDSAPMPLVVTKFTELAPAFSHDGRWLAYSSNETGDFEIYVVPFPNTHAAKWAISTTGGMEPVWSHRGSELFYRDSSENLVAAAVRTKPTFSVSRTTTLFPAGSFGASRFGQRYSVASDDSRFLMTRPLETTAPDKLVVVENWFQELKTSASRSRR